MRISSRSHAHESRFYLCLGPLLKALNWLGDDFKLEDALTAPRATFSEHDLVATMCNLFFDVQERSVNFNAVTKAELPGIFITPNGEPIALLSRSGRHVVFFNPASGIVENVRVRSARGRMLHFGKAPAEKIDLVHQTQMWFFKIVQRFNRLLLYTLIATLLLSLLEIVSPLIVMVLINQIRATQDVMSVYIIGSGILIYLASFAGVRLIRDRLLTYMGDRLGMIINVEAIRRILYLPPSFTEKASLAGQIARIKDFDSVQNFVKGSSLANIIEFPFIFVLMLAIFLIGGKIVIVPIATLAVFVILTPFLTYLISRHSASLVNASKHKDDFILDSFVNIRSIHLLGYQSRWSDRLKAFVKGDCRRDLNVATVSNIVNNFSYGLITVAGLCTMVVGVHLNFLGELSSGAMLGSMMLTWRAFGPLRSLFMISTQISKPRKSIAQIDRLMNYPIEKTDHETDKMTKRITGHVTFNQVSLRYSSDANPALLGVNFEVKSGETVVVLGHGGSGKTSVLKLIMAMYLPQAGRVLIDKLNSRQIDPLKLRREIAYLPEHPFVFNGTLAQNIRLASPLASPEQIEWALREAELWDEIKKFPQGFDTKMQSDNLSLVNSSFLKRFGFALMIAKNSRLWLLDNPGLGLDADLETRLRTKLLDFKKEITMIIATQNPKYIEIADKILWLANGRVKFFGTADQVASHLEHSA